MSALRRFLARHCRGVLVLASGGVIVAFWFGLWLRILGLPPRESVNLGRRIWPAVGAQNGNCIAIAGNDQAGQPGVTVWDLVANKERVTIPRSAASTGHAWPAAFSGDGALLASMESRNSNFGVLIWDLAATRLLMEVWHDRYTESVAFAPDKSAVAMLRYEMFPNGGSGHVIRIWDLSTQKDRVIDTATVGVRSLVYSPDGRHLAAGYWGDSSRPGAIRIWDAATGKEKAPLSVPAYPYAVAFSPDGRTLASADSEGYIRLWDVETGLARVLCHCENDDVEVKRMRFSPDGRILAVEEDRNVVYSPKAESWPDWLKEVFTSHTVTLWDTQSGERLARLPEDHLLAFTDDGRSLVTYGCNGSLRWWDAPPPEPIGYFLALAAVPSLLFTFLLWWRWGR